MRKLVVLCGLFLLVGGVVAAESFFVTLEPHKEYLEAKGPHFRVTGDLAVDTSFHQSGIDLSTTVNLSHQAFNRTNITAFAASFVRRNGSIVEEAELGSSGTIQRFSSRQYSTSVSLDTSPYQTPTLVLSLNHSALKRDGTWVSRHVRNTVNLTTFVPRQHLQSFQTNMSEAYRGQQVFVSGSIVHAERVKVAETVLPVTEGTFAGWVTMPVDVEAGTKPRLRLRTNAGKLFQRTLNVTALNKPPTVDAAYADRIEQGETLDVDISSTDDTGIRSIEIRFRGDTWTNRTGEFTLPTSNLSKGRYSFRVTVTDEGNKTVRSTERFEIVADTTQQAPSNNSGEEDNAEENNQSSSIPLLGAFRELVMNFILGLLGGAGS